MAFEGLTEKLNAAFQKLKSRGRITESDVKDAMRAIRVALLEADVNFKVARDFIQKVSERAVGQNVLESLTPAQQVIKIVNEELVSLMGSQSAKIKMASSPPTVVMLCGLQGAGKTTNGAKLAGMYKTRENRRPLLVACDVYRPAAVEQLKVVGKKLDVPVFSIDGEKDPVKIAREAVSHAKAHGNDIVFLDTAGRLHIDEEMMDELKRIKAAVSPNEILFFVDAMTGQDAVNAAAAFDGALSVDGVFLTKLDGDARGGAALSVRAVTGKPIKFCGVGEKLDQIEAFHPDRMASRILGMGDMLSLIEKAQLDFDEKKALELEKKMRTQRLTLTDFYDQLVQMKKMGSLQDIMGMVPGLNAKALKNASVDEKQLSHVEAIILSMTVAERENPSIINYSRKKRIASGCGLKIEEINRLLKQFEAISKMTKQLSSMQKKPGRKFGGFNGPGGFKLPF